eukprot:9781243-Ditylum_brightwellii.AAC.1
MQQQDWFIFSKTIDQWEKSTLTEMKQWVTLNKAYIKFCLSMGLKQKQLHSSDIQTYLPTTTNKSIGKRTSCIRGNTGSTRR